MTRFRNRLLITLALFAVASVAVVATASAVERWSDGTGAPTGTIGDYQRPGVGPCSGEPDIGASPGTAPQKQVGTKSASPPLMEQLRRGHDLMRRAGRIWAPWFPVYWR